MAEISQQEILTTYIIKGEGEETRVLFDIVNDMTNDRIVPAPFQREFIWKREKIIGWIKSIINKKSIGVLVTYQLSKGSAVFLADGVQRLTATKRFTDSPQTYGFKFGTQQAEEYTRSFRIPIQHRLYDSHEDALQAFQNINNGTSLMSGEYFKGELTLKENGKIIHEEIPRIIEKYETKYITPSRSRERVNKQKRNALAIYYQYVTDFKGQRFWDSVSNKVYNVQVIEKKIAEHIEHKTRDEIEDEIKKFGNFIRLHFGDFDEVYVATGNNGLKISYGVIRWMIHFHLYCNANNKPYDVYRKIIEKIMTKLKEYSKATSTIEFETKDGREQYAFTISAIKTPDYLANLLGVPEFNKPAKGREKKIDAAPGYHEHHIQPFSKFGEGETKVISALRNMSIGNREEE